MAKYKAEDLLDELVSEHTIQCSKCKKSSNVMMIDEYEACEHFFDDGWRKTPNHCYCPECAIKKLKP